MPSRSRSRSNTYTPPRTSTSPVSRTSRSISRSRSPSVRRDRSRSPSEKRRDRSRSRRHDRSRSPRRERSPSRRDRTPSRRERSPPRRDRSPPRHRRERRSESRARSLSPSSCENGAISNAWKEVKRDADNFDAWMNILTLVEQFNDLPIAREVYDRFLAKYPYCYGFWKKYAELERRNEKLAEAINVWERGILAIPMSVDLWQGFLAFMRELAPHSEGGIEKLKQLYDRALSMAGLEFNSDRLWNDAIAWEESRGDWQRVTKIYDQLIQIPTALYKSHYERFESIIKMYEPDVLLDSEEYEEIFALTRKHIDMGIDQIVTEESVLVEDGPPDAIAENGEVKPKLVKRKKHHPEALAFFRAEMLARRQRRHERTAAMISARLPFEEQIKRPYFHVKPLEKAQLKNWRQYLDFEIEEGNERRIIVLFERCLIACALYDEFWTKFARWSGKRCGSKAAQEIFSRALVHCPKSVSLVMAMSAFEEARGDFEEALYHLDKFDRKHPGYAAIHLRRIGLFRRRAEMDNKPDYSEVIRLWEELIHAPDTSRTLSSYYSVKLARFHLKSRNDRRLAEKVLTRALERDADNVQLHLQIIDLAYNDIDFSQTRLLEAFDAAINSRIPDAERVRLSQRKLDFLEDLSYDIEIVQEHQEFHQTLLREIEVPPALHTRKRKYEREERDSRDSRDRRGSDRRGRDIRHSDGRRDDREYSYRGGYRDRGDRMGAGGNGYPMQQQMMQPQQYYPQQQVYTTAYPQQQPVIGYGTGPGYY